MSSPILGLHHVTATVDDAQSDLDFFAGALGMRLVKRTVNFDNHHVYHFYYGDAAGTPGTIWTTFPYKGHGVRIGTKGTGQITATSLSVPDAALAFWSERLAACHFTVRQLAPRFGEPVLAATDTSGLVIELVGTTRD
jgi:glyoxalase family protein